MENTIRKMIYKTYGLEILDCILNELSKIPEFERLVMVKHAHEFISKECTDEIAGLLLDENNIAEYTRLKRMLDALLVKKKEQLINILEADNITALIGGE